MDPRMYPQGSTPVAVADLVTNGRTYANYAVEVLDPTTNTRKFIKLSDLFKTPPSITATITVGAENANVRVITVQLQDANGADLDYAAAVIAIVGADAAGAAFSSGGSTGLAIGTDGALLALVAKQAFILTGESDGDIDLTWTDTGTAAAYLILIDPVSGRLLASAAMTNA